MDIGSLSLSKITSKMEDNATLLAFGISAVGKAAEVNPGNLVNQIIVDLNPLQNPMQQGPIYELQKTFSSVDQLKYKLLDAPHLPQTLFKWSAGIWLVGQLFDFIPSRWVKVAGNVAKGAGAACLILPGSGPADYGTSSFTGNRRYSY